MPGQFFISKERSYCIVTLLYRQYGIFPDLPYGQQSVAGSDQILWIHIDGTHPTAYFSTKEIIKASDMRHFIIRGFNAVVPYKRTDQKMGQSGIKKCSA